MPLYDFRCNNCRAEFELLLFSGEKGECPDCGGTSLKRLPSLFGYRSAGTGNGSSRRTSSASGCGSCRRSGCASCHS